MSRRRPAGGEGSDGSRSTRGRRGQRRLAVDPRAAGARGRRGRAGNAQARTTAKYFFFLLFLFFFSPFLLQSTANGRFLRQSTVDGREIDRQRPILAVPPGSDRPAYRSAARPVCIGRYGALPLEEKREMESGRRGFREARRGLIKEAQQKKNTLPEGHHVRGSRLPECFGFATEEDVYCTTNAIRCIA
ncbi:hypothetical protein GW17_00038826 [Ensete ventricosum]|nr:hypothetical protein GW17_00038826 [Ensete ventricosum]